MIERDEHGQPLNVGLNAARRQERDVSEMLGLVKGVLADGVVSADEATLLRDWARAHPDAVATWPGSALYHRLERVFSDGQISIEEQADLADLLAQLAGGRAGIIAGDNAATSLPLDRPPPVVTVVDRTFVFTGKFAFGPRTACEAAVRNLGGQCASNVTYETSYLVIGTFGSRDWIHTSHGRKIEQAVKYRSTGVPLRIIAEDHWAAAFP